MKYLYNINWSIIRMNEYHSKPIIELKKQFITLAIKFKKYIYKYLNLDIAIKNTKVSKHHINCINYVIYFSTLRKLTSYEIKKMTYIRLPYTTLKMSSKACVRLMKL